MRSNFKSVYVAFDPYPSHKGSAIHIEKASGVLDDRIGDTLLLTLAAQTKRRTGSKIKHLQFKTDEQNFLSRGLAFSRWVDGQLDQQHQLRVGHFRDIWGGIPIVNRPHITSVFEVNGLPSIELPSRFSHIGQGTIDKIKRLEDECLAACNHVICPSQTIRAHLVSRGVSCDKITVISNGATPPPRKKKISFTTPKRLPTSYIVYFGALQPWQGIDVLLKSMQYLADKPHLKLVICTAHKPKHSRPYMKLARKLDLTDQVIWMHKLSKKRLFRVIDGATCTIAPLTECARNLEQGCSPLKIFESMACKAPIIASDLPVVREILVPDKEAKLVKADRPAELARAIRLLIDYPEYGQKLADAAYTKFLNRYTWDKIDRMLSEFYDKLVTLAIH